MPRWNLKLALKAIPKYLFSVWRILERHKQFFSPRYRITTLALIPSVVHAILSSPKLIKSDFTSVVNVGCGAAYLPPVLSDKLKETFKNVTVAEGMYLYMNFRNIHSASILGYGMSEAVSNLDITYFWWKYLKSICRHCQSLASRQREFYQERLNMFLIVLVNNFHSFLTRYINILPS